MAFRRALIPLVIASAVILLASPGRGADPALSAARALAAAGERGAARAVLDSLLAAGEAVPEADRNEALLLRADLESDGQAYQERLRGLLESEKSPARQALLHLALGRIAFAQGNLDIALHEFRTAVDQGRSEEGNLWVGLTALALGDGDTAREALDRAAGSGNLAIRQRARVALGDSYRLAGRWEEAAARYAEVEEDGAGGPGWWSTAAFQRARCLEELGRTAEAADLLETLLTRAPGSFEAPLARARLALLGSLPPEGPEAPPPAPEAGEEPSGTPVATPGAFAVQVGAFGEKSNAEKLAGTVRGAGFEPVRVKEGSDGLFRVLVGRLGERARAESLGDSLGVVLGLGYTVVTDRGN